MNCSENVDVPLASLKKHICMCYTDGWLKAAVSVNRVNVYVASLPLYLRVIHYFYIHLVNIVIHI